MDIAKLRSEIPATQRVIYLNTGWSGPSPRVVMERIRECLEYENCEGPASPPVIERQYQTIEESRRTIARLLGASHEEIAITENTTEAINIVLNGLDWKPGDEVITCDLEHSSILIPCYHLPSRFGVSLKVVKLWGANDKDSILSRLEAAMSSRTRLICLSHVAYCTGYRLPLSEIQDLARHYGAMVLVDGAQAVGQMPVDVKELGCEFYALPGHKWLLGPEGTGALYVRRDVIPLVKPAKLAENAVLSYDREGNFSANTDSVTKFELTTFSTPLIAGLATAIKFLQDAGFDEIRARIIKLSEMARGRLVCVPGLRIHGPMGGDSASGLVSFSIENRRVEDINLYLCRDRKIIARTLPWPPSIRLSIDFFNTEEEIEHTAACIASFANC